MKRLTIVYFDAGDNYKGTHDLDRNGRRWWHNVAKNSEHIGYLIGYRYWDNEKETVLIYCKEKPSMEEINRRRANGFKAATWYWLN